MTPEETREKLAAFMDWKAFDLDNSCGDPDCCGGPYPMWTYCENKDREWLSVSLQPAGPYSGSLDVEDWRPDEDRNQLAFVLGKVMEKGLESKLINELCPNPARFEYSASDLWDCLTAPPHLVCAAILKVI